MTKPEPPAPDSSFYVIGGTLRADAPCYVERQADRDLLAALRQGEYCYILTSRQMGKSSLMVRTAQRLRAEGVDVAALDLTAIGQNITPEQWYDGLLVRLGRQLRLEDALEDYWRAQEHLGPVQRWFSALREVVLPRLNGNLVIFVDEIDVVRSLPFSTDEYFAAIRECFTRRAVEPEFKRLSFCLLGVAMPSDLIKDPRMTPFNIARRIELRDFTEAEAQPLAGPLGRSPFRARRLLRRVLYWTSGHPYLTQRLCQAVAAAPSVRRKRHVDRVCREIFLSHRARERDDNLLFVRERLLRTDADLVKLLRLYRRVHLTTKVTGLFRLGLGLGKLGPVADAETNPLVGALRLSGITREEKGFLAVRNRIYYHAFDRDWVTANMPEIELWRLWVMFLAGTKRLLSFVLRAITLVVLALVASAIIILLWVSAQPDLRHVLLRHPTPSAAVHRPKPVTPPRSPDARANLIDLSGFYNAALTQNWHDGVGGSLAALAPGVRSFHNIAFDVRGIVQLAGGKLNDRGYPARVADIPVRRKCARLHFLHATGWPEAAGRHVGSYVVHYADGQRCFIPLLYDQETQDWAVPSSIRQGPTGARIAWEGPPQGSPSSESARRLYLFTWTNPLPEIEINSLDFESAMNDAAPFLVALTVEP